MGAAVTLQALSRFGDRLLEQVAERAPGGAALAVVLSELDRECVVSGSALQTYVPRAFDSCSWPCDVLDVDQWVALFRGAGYTRDWRPAEAPTAPRRLFRGSLPEGADGMHWTSELRVARYFALRVPGGVVSVADVPADRQLAELGTGWEDEVVIDPLGLAIKTLETPGDLAVCSLAELRSWIHARQGVVR